MYDIIKCKGCEKTLVLNGNKQYCSKECREKHWRPIEAKRKRNKYAYKSIGAYHIYE